MSTLPGGVSRRVGPNPRGGHSTKGTRASRSATGTIIPPSSSPPSSPSPAFDFLLLAPSPGSTRARSSQQCPFGTFRTSSDRGAVTQSPSVATKRRTRQAVGSEGSRRYTTSPRAKVKARGATRSRTTSARSGCARPEDDGTSVPGEDAHLSPASAGATGRCARFAGATDPTQSLMVITTGMLSATSRRRRSMAPRRARVAVAPRARGRSLLVETRVVATGVREAKSVLAPDLSSRVDDIRRRVCGRAGRGARRVTPRAR